MSPTRPGHGERYSLHGADSVFLKCGEDLAFWITLSLCSAIFLGLYDIAKKSAVRDNAVPPVLLLNVLTAALLWSLPILMSYVAAGRGFGVSIDSLSDISARQHILLFAKSVLVGASWTLALFALKHLPISIATPIRSTSPLWVLACAVLVLGERPSGSQWLGIAIVLLAFLSFSRVGLREGIRFHRDRWIAMMLGATLLGSASSIYDKFLLQTMQMSPAVVQAWFSIYLVPVMCPLAGYWYWFQRRANPFQWRWSIPMIAVLLLIADYLYFFAITEPGALISVISTLRRSSVIVAFLFGVLQLKEQNWRAKAPCIVAILIGVILIGW